MVRPMDVQQTVLLTNPIEKIQQTQQRHPDMQQRYFETHLKDQKNLESQQVHQPDKTEKMRVTQRDEQKEGRQNQSRNQDRKKESPHQDDEKTEFQGHLVDTRV